jgi:hypothetical protein
VCFVYRLRGDEAIELAAMAGLLLLILLLQGIPVQQGGSVRGVLRDSAGQPIPGVRMAAILRPDSLENINEGTAMAGLAETDAEGKYTLENIPPGRYVIAAGRLDLQTYYPGTQELKDARVVVITPGAVVADINFVLNSTSLGRSPESLFLRIVSNSTTVPFTVSVENGGKLPLSVNGRFVTIRFALSSGGEFRTAIDSGFVSLGGLGPVDVKPILEDLPENYTVKSIRYGTTDVTGGTFRLTAANFAQPISFTAVQGTTTQQLQIMQTTFQSVVNGVTPPSELFITLSEKPAVHSAGSHVTGFFPVGSRRHIYVSGRPGIVYADGTFEFRGVPPGRHLIATVNNPSMPLAAVVVVGETDVTGIELKETFVLPDNIRQPSDSLPAGDYKPGTTVPLARVRGIVLEETTKEPIREGEIVIRVGDYSRSVPIDETGRFETFSLLPGTYEVRFQIFAHSTVGPQLVVEDKDLELQLTSRRLY